MISEKSRNVTPTDNRSADDIKLANTRTVDSLQRVYAIVIALALTTAVKLLIESVGIVKSASPQVDPVPTIGMFVAFVSTLVIFYQGMNRHLDDSFIIDVKTDRSSVLLLVDIFVFLVEGSMLVVMASTIADPQAFLKAWSILLAVDIIWGLFLYLFTSRQTPVTWVVTNAAFLGSAWIVWLFIFPKNALWIVVIEILRSVIDYRLNWDFYFPRKWKS